MILGKLRRDVQVRLRYVSFFRHLGFSVSTASARPVPEANRTPRGLDDARELGMMVGQSLGYPPISPRKEPLCAFTIPSFAYPALLPHCGTQVSGGTTWAEARAGRIAWNPVGTDDGDVWLAVVIKMEPIRDDGTRRRQAISDFTATDYASFDPTVTVDLVGCVTCFTQLIDVARP